MSNQFDIYGDELYHCDWYLFSIKFQRMLLMILTNSQQPVVIRGYGNIECTRDTFKKVKKGILIQVHTYNGLLVFLNYLNEIGF